MEREEELAKLLVSDLIWRFADELGQLLNVAQVSSLGPEGQAFELHVLEHALPEWGHEKTSW